MCLQLFFPAYSISGPHTQQFVQPLLLLSEMKALLRDLATPLRPSLTFLKT